MYIYNKEQRTELRKIVDFLLSKDLEISKMGITMLRKSKLYRDLKSQTVFYYPKKITNSQKRMRLSTFISTGINIIHNVEGNSTNCRAKAKYALKVMFDDLMSCDANQYFRREFINNSNLL